MNTRLRHFLKIAFVVSCLATLFLYAAHPPEPKPHEDLRSYLAFSGHWHEVLFAVTLIQLISAAAIFGAAAAAGQTMMAAGLVLAVTGLNFDLIHAAAEGFVFPSIASTLNRTQMLHAVGAFNAAPSILVTTIAGMAAAAAGLLLLALSKDNARLGRILAGAGAVLLPLPIVVPAAFDAFALAMYGAFVAAAVTLRF